MTVVMGWLARSRTVPALAADSRTLAHPRTTLIVGLACTGLFLALAVLSATFPGKTGSVWVTLLFLGFAAMGFFLLLDYRNARHSITEDGLQYGKLLGGRGVLRWREVRRLVYSESAKWFRLELSDGRVVRISAMLIGLPSFARAALDHVPAAAIAGDTRTLLEATAAGNLPSIWN
jgi:Bacterial PH domain